MRENLEAAVTKLNLEEPPLFEHIILVDDFSGSGYTLISEGEGNEWRGKLIRARDEIERLKGKVTVDDPRIWVVLYTASEQAREYLGACLMKCALNWEVKVVHLIPSELPHLPPAHPGVDGHHSDLPLPLGQFSQQAGKLAVGVGPGLLLRLLRRLDACAGIARQPSLVDGEPEHRRQCGAVAVVGTHTQPVVTDALGEVLGDLHGGDRG